MDVPSGWIQFSGDHVRSQSTGHWPKIVTNQHNIVDATTVDLSSSPYDSVVNALELDLAVDEEFDGEERNDEEAAAVPWEEVVANGNGRPPSRRLRLIGASMDGLPHSRNMHDEVPSTVVANLVPSLPSTIPASSTVLREAHPNPHGRCSVLSDRVDSEPELWVDHTILDSVEGVVDHRRMPDTDSDSTESVQFPDEVLSDVEAFREEIDFLSRKSRFHCPGGPEECSWTGCGAWMVLTFAKYFGGGQWS